MTERPEFCACGERAYYGNGVKLRRGEVGEWKCRSCAIKAGWLQVPLMEESDDEPIRAEAAAR
jgi:hypothetical protein